MNRCTSCPSGEFFFTAPQNLFVVSSLKLTADQNQLSRNVMTISSVLASSPIGAVRQIGIIGVGGVTSPAAYKRMRDAGAAAVACATALGVNGVGVFEKLLDDGSGGLA